MHWTVAAPFIRNPSTDGEWLLPYVLDDRHEFSVVGHDETPISWHKRTSRVTSYQQWLAYFQQARTAVSQTRGGVITVFPQLASAVGLNQQIARKPVPIVSWLFNVGFCYSGVRQWLAQVSLKNVSRFVVHTRRECELYSQWLGLPKERFEFIPYQSPEIPALYEENTRQPFLVALGSAHRDFPTLFAAVQQLNLPIVVASGKRSLAGLDIPAQVKTPFDIEKKDCLRLAQEARISVIPMYTNERVTAAGQVTIVEAMRMGRAVIASRCNGAEDYIIHGETGILVEPHSVQALRDAIEMLWNDEALRNRLGESARKYAAEHYSDETAGQALRRVLNTVANSFEDGSKF